MLLVTNTRGFPRQWTASTGEQGETAIANSASEFLGYSSGSSESILLVDCAPDIVFALARALWRNPAPSLIAVDMVLRRPEKFRSWVALPLKRKLLRRVDHFIHYFRDLRGLKSVYGISPEKSSYVPFKPNLAMRADTATAGEGEYVLCFGRSLRDFDTFFAAMERLPYPGAIAEPNLKELAAHGARFGRPLADVPKNVLVLPDDNSAEAQIRLLSGARLVVLPILKKTLVASGISTCLNAMLLGRCVIASSGPGTSDVFGPELLTVPPEDPGALADMIRRAWEDDTLRRESQRAGQAVARGLGGEAELYQRIVDDIVGWRGERTRA